MMILYVFMPGIFSPAEGSAAGRAVSPARCDFDYHGAFKSMFADQSPEQVNFVLKMMNFASKRMSSALKMMKFRAVVARPPCVHHQGSRP